MRAVRSGLLLAVIALGVTGMIWLVSRLPHEIERPGPSDEQPDLRASNATAQAPPPTVAPYTTPGDDSLLSHLARWARSPQERTRWTNALKRDGAGLSPFERRLWIGDLLEHLSRDLYAGTLSPKRAHALFIELYEAGVLRIERSPSIVRMAAGGHGTDGAGFRVALRSLVWPARARRAFTLQGREADALATGSDLRLRVWMPPGQSIPQARVDATLSLLARLDAIAGVESPASVDVLATAGGGKDILRQLSRLPFPFIGVYLPADRLAVVGTRHPPDQFRRLLQHEVIHAWQHAARPDWRTTFTIEGLATYGSHLQPSDAGLTVPASHLRNDFAWLLDATAQLSRRGEGMDRLHLGALVRASAWDFYSLGWFAYAVAEACCAYVGADALESALRHGGEEALLARFDAIEWPDLLRWLGERAAGGKASEAWFVTESPLPGAGEVPEQDRYQALLADLGFEVSSGRREELAYLLHAERRATTADEHGSRTASPRVPPADGRSPQYLGVRGCKKCHFRESRSWKRLAHARAFEMLEPEQAVERKRAAGLDPAQDFRENAACLRCHTTGFGTPSGYTVRPLSGPYTDAEVRRAKDLAGVGCEACHGPGSAYAPYKKDHEDYLRADIVALGARVPLREEHCTGCHRPGCPTMPRVYTFDFEAARQSDRLHEQFPLKHRHGADDR